jgi:hypothetical protein
MRPPESRPTPAEAAHASERWLARLQAGLDSEERALEAADLEEVVRAAEHRQAEDERALWEERVARQPELARRAAELAAFGAEAYPEGARVLAFPGAPARTAAPWLGWAAAAAAVLLAILLRPDAPTITPQELQAGPAPDLPAETLFADGFEGGDPSSWAAVSSSG